MRKYKHLFFDLDHTLWDFEKNSAEAISEIITKNDLLEKGVPSAESFLDRYHQINNEQWELYRQGAISKEVLRVIRFKMVLHYFGINDDAVAEKISKDYIYISPRKTNLMKGALAILEYLQTEYNMHIITNGFEEVQHIKLDRSGLRPFFDQVITSEKANSKKPHPEIYHYAMVAANANIHESLMIGDSIESDLRGAQGVYMDQVFFNPQKHKHSFNFTIEINELSELKKYL